METLLALLFAAAAVPAIAAEELEDGPLHPEPWDPRVTAPASIWTPAPAPSAWRSPLPARRAGPGPATSGPVVERGGVAPALLPPPPPVPVPGQLSPLPASTSLPTMPLEPPPWHLELSPFLGSVQINEQFPSGGLVLVPEAVERFGLQAALRAATGWRLSARVEHLAFTIVDRQLTGSRHHRDEFAFALGLGGDVAAGAGTVGLGAGYWLRHVAVANNLPPPPGATFLTAPSQLIHGPNLELRFVRPLAPDWAAGAAAELRPWLMPAGSEPLPALGPMVGYGAGAWLRWRSGWGPTAELGYRFEWLGGYDVNYVRAAQGPVLGVQASW